MTLFDFDFRDGYYDDNGEWQRTKFCFVSCGAACTCGPPGGLYYSAAHDKRRSLGGADPSGAGGPPRSGPEGGVCLSCGAPLHVPVEGADATAEGSTGDQSEVKAS